MDTGTITCSPATREHFDAIVAIERASGGASVVSLTAGLALDEALTRGHDVVVAIEDGVVAGWIWFSVDGSRAGEEVGQLFRVGVMAGRVQAGAALLEHARTTLAARGCIRVRATLAADDGASRVLVEGLGFALDAVTLERLL